MSTIALAPAAPLEPFAPEPFALEPFVPVPFAPVPAGAAIGTAYLTFSEVRSARRETVLIVAVAAAALCTLAMLIASVLLAF